MAQAWNLTLTPRFLNELMALDPKEVAEIQKKLAILTEDPSHAPPIKKRLLTIRAIASFMAAVTWSGVAEAGEEGALVPGVHASALWILQPGAPGTDYGGAGEIGFFADWRPSWEVPLSARLELGLNAQSDSGDGTLGIVTRWMAGIHLAQPVIWHLGVQLGLHYFAESYSSGCATCPGRERWAFMYGAYSDILLCFRHILSNQWAGRVEVGLSFAFHAIELYTTVFVGEVGARVGFAFWAL